MDTTTINQLIQTIEAMQQSIAAINERVIQLETASSRQAQVLNIIPLQNVVTSAEG